MKALMHLKIPVRRQKITEERKLSYEMIFPQLDPLPLSERSQFVLDFDCGAADSGSEDGEMAQKGELKHAVLGEVTMRPTDFRDAPEEEENFASGQAEAKIEVLTDPIADPGLVDVAPRPLLREIRVRLDDDTLQRRILEIYHQLPPGAGLKVDFVADKLEQPREAVKQ